MNLNNNKKIITKPPPINLTNRINQKNNMNYIDFNTIKAAFYYFSIDDNKYIKIDVYKVIKYLIDNSENKIYICGEQFNIENSFKNNIFRKKNHKKINKLKIYNNKDEKIIFLDRTYIINSNLIANSIQHSIVNLDLNTCDRKKCLFIIPERWRLDQQYRITSIFKKHINLDAIYVFVHQNNPIKCLFNRGNILNIGYDIGKNIKINGVNFNPDYIVLHDIDMFDISAEGYDYSYTNTLTQLCGSILNYKKIGEAVNSSKRINIRPFCGGINIINAKIFEECNGFSNIFNGWGYEDRNLIKRFNYRGYLPHCRYGEFESNINERNLNINNKLNADVIDELKDGLTTLNYKVLNSKNNGKFYDYYVNNIKIIDWSNIVEDNNKAYELLLNKTNKELIINAKLEYWHTIEYIFNYIKKSHGKQLKYKLNSSEFLCDIYIGDNYESVAYHAYKMNKINYDHFYLFISKLFKIKIN